MFVIIGATGRIGGAAARELRRRGRAVRAVVRDPGKASALAEAGCEIAAADIADTGALTAALQGAAGVLAIVPLAPSRGDAAAEARGLIESLSWALEAARPPRTVAISDYGAQHAAGTGITELFHHLEQRLGGLPGVTFLRSAEHMQNWARSLRPAMATGFLASLHHPLDKRFPTVSAPDVGLIAADLLAAAAVPPRILHAEGPQRYTALDAAAALAGPLGRSVQAVALPRGQWEQALAAGGLSEGYVRLITDLYDAHNAGRIEVEGGEVRRGTTPLAEVLAALVRRAAG
ncbi:NmrA family transcriptional regulator [Mycobacterium sp. KBS0706]|uniref:NmrA family NAD(P)-binding protein n=1 Tax=Mycobacterium sp. KBS0706 TaxID=2578109 RepID=UPI00110FEE76|nr:NAD(P)H-binding protein [Mycobacterium sp. KBS0706]TSD90787.1 NmrA family transcriptional regulator [Mycobacterium sp. KBS0706]